MTEEKKENQKIVNLIIISDSVGDTAFNMVQAGAVQYPDVKFNYRRYPFITNREKLEKVFNEITEFENVLIAFTLIHEDEQLAAIKFAREHNMKYVDLLSGVIENIHSLTGEEPKHEIGAVHHMGQNYFDRISAMEFAVMYDDGKDPKGFLEADVCFAWSFKNFKDPSFIVLSKQEFESS